jgi:hypothetical protein
VKLNHLDGVVVVYFREVVVDLFVVVVVVVNKGDRALVV